MRFGRPLIHATLERRYKRFLADVCLASGRRVTVHCPNPGSMLGLAEPGLRLLLSDAGSDSGRRLRFTWELVRVGRAWVCINTLRANQVAREALCAGAIRPLARSRVVRAEVRSAPHSRLDFLLDGEGIDTLVEVKSVTMRKGSAALFPDAPTERGQRHLLELARQARMGRRAVLLYLVMRGDCRWVGSANSIDPMYGRTLRDVVARGVEAIAYVVRVSPRGLELGRRLPVRA
jgi:sugar fermentation stimulation protein A